MGIKLQKNILIETNNSKILITKLIYLKFFINNNLFFNYKPKI